MGLKLNTQRQRLRTGCITADADRDQWHPILIAGGGRWMVRQIPSRRAAVGCIAVAFALMLALQTYLLA